jgi:LacI family transcriptional regulator/LacI family purine nucleotide synthesis repressor
MTVANRLTMNKVKPATLKDISRALGVSVSTVSHALNNYSDISEETRLKVIETARNLGYQLDIGAHGLRRQRSLLIGFVYVSPAKKVNVFDQFVFEVFSGLKYFLGETEFDLMVACFPTDRREAIIETPQRRKVEGMIVLGLRETDPEIEMLLKLGIPIVFIDIPIVSLHCGFVSSNNVKGGYLAGKHLIELGHTNIAYVSGEEGSWVSKEREVGLIKALRESNLEISASFPGYFLEEGGAKATLKILEEKPNVTGIFYASDIMAMGGIRKLRAMGVRVPEDISVIGFDDILASRYSYPSLTTIRQEKWNIGYEAGRLILDIISGKEGEHRELDTTLIVRETTKRR